MASIFAGERLEKRARSVTVLLSIGRLATKRVRESSGVGMGGAEGRM
jgi:hypothetical protein